MIPSPERAAQNPWYSFVLPFQGKCHAARQTQGVALGCHVVALAARQDAKNGTHYKRRGTPFSSFFILTSSFLASFFILPFCVCAQQGAPHLAYVYPAGGQTGTTFEITVGGQFLLSVSNAIVSGDGVSATVMEHHRPMNQKEFNDLRDRLKVLREKFQAARRNGFASAGTNTWTEADTKEREEIRAKILMNPPNRKASPAMIDTVTLKLSIAANAQPSEREIRLVTPLALSNPMRFVVGTLPEVARPAAKPANPDFDKFLEMLGGRPAPAGTPKYEANVSLPVTINGQIMPGGVDRYHFFAKQGQQLIIAASARSLIPYLADAVPGWFEAAVTLLDAKGSEIASAERYRFKPDPVLHFQVPRDGQYTIEIHDSIFRGREDFVYRLTLGELPFITGIFPLGGHIGEKTRVELAGWNLPDKTLTVGATEPESIIAVGANTFNTVPFAVDDLPECLAGPSNHSAESAQEVTLPVIINGRISQPAESEVFKFQGHAGQKIVAEVFARRLDSPLDSFLRLTDATGKQLAFNDDFEDKGSGLNTFHADSYLTNTLPADGVYFIHLTDTQGQGGPEFGYRLRLSGPRPDFALRIVPSSLSLRTGMSVPVTVYALRRDGFTNAITLGIENAPPGFSLSGATIAAGQDKAQFTLKAPSEAGDRPVAIAIEGRADIGGAMVTREAVPAEDLMQAFFYRHLVPSKELAVVVNGQSRPLLRDAFKIMGGVPVKLAPGGTARVRVSAPSENFASRFELQLDNPPDGISLTNVSAVPGGLELVFSCDSDKVKPGSIGNLICDVVLRKNATPTATKKPGRPGKAVAIATLPAMPFSVGVR
jgi:hypothetical protein